MPSLPRWMHRSLLRAVHPMARAWWRISHPSVRGAYVVVCRDRGTPNEAWLCVRNSYKPGLSVPGGGIEAGESPHAAACRELLEEVGLRVPGERLHATHDFVIDYLHRHDHVYFFEIELGPDEASAPVPDGREIAWADFVALRELTGADLVAPVRHYLEERERR